MEIEYLCLKLGQIIELNTGRLNHVFERHLELQDFESELELAIRKPEIVL